MERRMIEQIGEMGVVPVVVLNESQNAVPLADALCEGDFHVQK